MKRLAGRIIAYLVLIALGIVGIAPFLYLAVLSTKRRIEILAQVPPTPRFQLGARSPRTITRCCSARACCRSR